MKLARLEFWIATAFLAFALHTNMFMDFELTQEYLTFRALPVLMMAIGVYFSFIIINNIIVPRNLPDKKWENIVLQCVGVMLLLLAIFTTADQLRPPGYPFRVSVEKSFLLALPVMAWVAVIIVVYNALKFWLIKPGGSGKSEKEKLTIQALSVTIVWFPILIYLMLADNVHMGPYWITAVPSILLIYFLDRFWLWPDYHLEKNKNHKYWIRIGSAIIVAFTISFLVWSTTEKGMYEASYVACYLFCLVVALGCSRFSFSQHLKQLQLRSLKTDLGKSSADLQFLRSQINPHFLFNVLNTLYGTAMQENADRTSEGIQKLGDMMRFMLHENTLDAIPVAREIDYLKDYIYLQKLRIANSSQINVEVNLPENPCHHTIAPMLLIPFVENAFKHGVSLQNRSWITISLHCEADRLDFDIYNSLHSKRETDTERFHGGIGLENVKQRLELLYAGKHELTIRQSQTEYFVHMTVLL